MCGLKHGSTLPFSFMEFWFGTCLFPGWFLSPPALYRFGELLSSPHSFYSLAGRSSPVIWILFSVACLLSFHVESYLWLCSFSGQRTSMCIYVHGGMVAGSTSWYVLGVQMCKKWDKKYRSRYCKCSLTTLACGFYKPWVYRVGWGQYHRGTLTAFPAEISFVIPISSVSFCLSVCVPASGLTQFDWDVLRPVWIPSQNLIFSFATRNHFLLVFGIGTCLEVIDQGCGSGDGGGGDGGVVSTAVVVPFQVWTRRLGKFVSFYRKNY